MRKRRLKNTIFILLALLLCGAGGLAAVAVLPSGHQALGTAVFAGTFLASPRTALAAMGRAWEDEHPETVTDPDDAFGLDFTDFLQLMVQQLQNQTMDNTTDTSDMLNQLVQMSVVQMMTTVKTSIDTLVDANTLTYAASLVGKTVTVGEYGEDGKLQEVVGTVTGTGTYQGVPVIFVDGEMYALSDIMAVGTLPDIPETPDEPEGDSGEGGDTQTPET